MRRLCAGLIVRVIERSNLHVGGGIMNNSARFPKFYEVSNRQLEEALSVIRSEFDSKLENADELSGEDKHLLEEIRSVAAFSYIRRRLPELLGFYRTK